MPDLIGGKASRILGVGQGERGEAQYQIDGYRHVGCGSDTSGNIGYAMLS